MSRAKQSAKPVDALAFDGSESVESYADGVQNKGEGAAAAVADQEAFIGDVVLDGVVFGAFSNSSYIAALPYHKV